MKVLMDTSTLVAAMLPDHIHHAHAYPWLAQAKSGVFEFVVSGHSLAEIYAVLTRLPRSPQIKPEEALRLIQENICSCATIVTLSGSDYVTMIEALSREKIIGGAIYDAVIAQAAEVAAVDQLLTLNVGHFQRVWPGGGNRIVSPQSLAPPASPA
jgi:predicted nucleic acid-binding protein